MSLEYPQGYPLEKMDPQPTGADVWSLSMEVYPEKLYIEFTLKSGLVCHATGEAAQRLADEYLDGASLNLSHAEDNEL